MRPAVLLDLDGTLVTFAFDVQGSRQAIKDLLGREGFDLSPLSLNDPTQKALDLARSQIESGRVATTFDSVKRQIFSLLDRFEEDSARKTVLFPDTVGTLESLRRASVRMAVLTNSGSAAVGGIIRRFGIAPFFEFVLTRDDIEAMKPRPEGVLQAVSKFSVPRELVWYVGDSVLDVMASKAAGVKSVSVATGNYPPDRLMSQGADAVIRALSELPALLGD